MQIKITDTTSHPVEWWLFFKRNERKEWWACGKMGTLCITGGNIKCCSCCRKQNANSSKTWNDHESESEVMSDSLLPVDCSQSGSSLHGILQARIVEWVAISFSKGSSRPRDQTWVSHIPGRRFNLWATREAQYDDLATPLLGMWASLVTQRVKHLACNAGDVGSIPGSGRSLGEGNGNPLHYSCLENPMEGGAWLATVHG